MLVFRTAHPLDSGVMCTMLYLASDSPLPVCPDSSWEGGATFFVRQLFADEDRLYRGAFTKRNVAYLGSADGCGCGFHYSPEEEVFSPEGVPSDFFARCVASRARTFDGLAKLHAFIREAALASDLELLIVWASKAPDSLTRRAVTVDHFSTYEQGTDLPENCLFEIPRLVEGERA